MMEGLRGAELLEALLATGYGIDRVGVVAPKRGLRIDRYTTDLLEGSQQRLRKGEVGMRVNSDQRWSNIYAFTWTEECF